MNVDLNPFVFSGSPYLTALLAGLFGGVHCAGMCGGIIGALVHGLPAEVRGRTMTLLPYVAAYNLGRLLSYVLAGTVVGHLGWTAAGLVSAYPAWMYLRIAAALLMIAMGFYLSGWWAGLVRLERLGGRAWEYIRPLGRRLFPIRSAWRALLLGLVWGWLPCGLVYTVLLWSLASGGWREGGLMMASFGFGTLPTLATLGLTAGTLGRWLQRRTTRTIAGIIVMFFGGWTLIATLVHRTNVGLGCPVPG